MKGFIDDIVKLLALPEPAGFKYIVVGNEAFFLQGIRFIKSLSTQEITIALKRGGAIIVAGEELNVAQLNSEEIVIKGKISKIERE